MKSTQLKLKCGFSVGFSMHGRSRSCGSQRRRSRHHWGTSPDMPDCWPANRQHVFTLAVKGKINVGWADIPQLVWQTAQLHFSHSPCGPSRLWAPTPAGLGRRRKWGSRVWPEGSCWWHSGGLMPPLRSDRLREKLYLHRTGRHFVAEVKCMSVKGLSGLTCDSWGNRAAQGSDARHGNLLRAVLGGAAVPGSDHVGFE